MIDEQVVEIFKRYYTLLQRDNPINNDSAIQAAATLTQAHILKEELNILSTPSPWPQPHDYTYKIEDISRNIQDLRQEMVSINYNFIEKMDKLIEILKDN